MDDQLEQEKQLEQEEQEVQLSEILNEYPLPDDISRHYLTVMYVLDNYGLSSKNYEIISKLIARLYTKAKQKNNTELTYKLALLLQKYCIANTNQGWDEESKTCSGPPDKLLKTINESGDNIDLEELQEDCEALRDMVSVGWNVKTNRCYTIRKGIPSQFYQAIRGNDEALHALQNLTTVSNQDDQVYVTIAKFLNGHEDWKEYLKGLDLDDKDNINQILGFIDNLEKDEQIKKEQDQVSKDNAELSQMKRVNDIKRVELDQGLLELDTKQKELRTYQANLDKLEANYSAKKELVEKELEDISRAQAKLTLDSRENFKRSREIAEVHKQLDKDWEDLNHSKELLRLAKVSVASEEQQFDDQIKRNNSKLQINRTIEENLEKTNAKLKEQKELQKKLMEDLENKDKYEAELRQQKLREAQEILESLQANIRVKESQLQELDFVQVKKQKDFKDKREDIFRDFTEEQKVVVENFLVIISKSEISDKELTSALNSMLSMVDPKTIRHFLCVLTRLSVYYEMLASVDFDANNFNIAKNLKMSLKRKVDLSGSTKSRKISRGKGNYQVKLEPILPSSFMGDDNSEEVSPVSVKLEPVNAPILPAYRWPDNNHELEVVFKLEGQEAEDEKSYRLEEKQRLENNLRLLREEKQRLEELPPLEAMNEPLVKVYALPPNLTIDPSSNPFFAGLWEHCAEKARKTLGFLKNFRFVKVIIIPLALYLMWNLISTYYIEHSQANLVLGQTKDILELFNKYQGELLGELTVAIKDKVLGGFSDAYIEQRVLPLLKRSGAHDDIITQLTIKYGETKDLSGELQKLTKWTFDVLLSLKNNVVQDETGLAIDLIGNGTSLEKIKGIPDILQSLLTKINPSVPFTSIATSTFVNDIEKVVVTTAKPFGEFVKDQAISTFTNVSKIVSESCTVTHVLLGVMVLLVIFFGVVMKKKK